MSEIKDVLEITAEIPADLLDGIYLKAHLLGLYSLKIMADREEQQNQIDKLNRVVEAAKEKMHKHMDTANDFALSLSMASRDIEGLGGDGSYYRDKGYQYIEALSNDPDRED